MSLKLLRLLVFLFAVTATAVSSARIHKRLVNGDIAEPGRFPWMVSLRLAATSSHNCGGCIVTPEHIVTAAHCVANNVPIPMLPSQLFVVTGNLNTIEGGRFTRVSDVRIHPEYQPANSWRNDVAVLKLETPIPYTALEQPLPIATSNVGVEACVMSGWGRTIHPGRSLPSQQQTLVFNTMTRETCTEFWSENQIFNSTLCAGGIVGEGVCGGDSGSPLVCNGELAGIASWAWVCANGAPDAYARAYYFRDWFDANIADLSPLGKIYAAEALEARMQSLKKN